MRYNHFTVITVLASVMMRLDMPRLMRIFLFACCTNYQILHVVLIEINRGGVSRQMI